MTRAHGAAAGHVGHHARGLTMTLRQELDMRRREILAALVGWLADRAFTQRTRGVDGLAKRLLATQVPPVEHDPELDHPDADDVFGAAPQTPGAADGRLPAVQLPIGKV